MLLILLQFIFVSSLKYSNKFKNKSFEKINNLIDDNLINKLQNDLTTIINTTNNNNGYDNRFKLNNTDFNTYNKNENILNKKKLLDTLQSKISILDKINFAQDFLEQNNTININIISGNLYKDWNFII